MSQGEFLLYQAEDARTYIEVRFQEGGLWLTQQQLAELYQSTPQNITQHIRAIYETGELREEATCKPYLQVRQERGRGGKTKTSQYASDRIVRGGGMMEHLLRFYLKFMQWLPSINSDVLRWKSLGIEMELTIRKFRIVAPKAALGLKSCLQFWIHS